MNVICKCEKCQAMFEAGGMKTVDVLTHAQKCTECGGDLLIMAEQKQTKKLVGKYMDDAEEKLEHTKGKIVNDTENNP